MDFKEHLKERERLAEDIASVERSPEHFVSAVDVPTELSRLPVDGLLGKYIHIKEPLYNIKKKLDEIVANENATTPEECRRCDPLMAPYDACKACEDIKKEEDDKEKESLIPPGFEEVTKIEEKKEKLIPVERFEVGKTYQFRMPEEITDEEEHHCGYIEDMKDLHGTRLLHTLDIPLLNNKHLDIECKYPNIPILSAVAVSCHEMWEVVPE